MGHGSREKGGRIQILKGLLFSNICIFKREIWIEQCLTPRNETLMGVYFRHLRSKVLHVSLSCFIGIPDLAVTRWLFVEVAGGISAARTHRLDQKDTDQASPSSHSPASQSQPLKPIPSRTFCRSSSQSSQRSCLLKIWENIVLVIMYVVSGEVWFRHAWAPQVSH